MFTQPEILYSWSQFSWLVHKSYFIPSWCFWSCTRIAHYSLILYIKYNHSDLNKRNKISQIFLYVHYLFPLCNAIHRESLNRPRPLMSPHCWIIWISILAGNNSFVSLYYREVSLFISDTDAVPAAPWPIQFMCPVQSAASDSTCLVERVKVILIAHTCPQTVGRIVCQKHIRLISTYSSK